MRRTISIVGALILVACGGAGSESEELFDDGAGGHGSSDALTPDADSGAEDGAVGEDGAAPMVCAPGKVEACPCPGGGQGAQACREDGSGWGPCECGDGGAGGVEDAGPDAPDTSGWRWWCTHRPAAADGTGEACTCTFGASGSENIAACPPQNCCYVREVNGAPAECKCSTEPYLAACTDRIGSANGLRVSSCP